MREFLASSFVKEQRPKKLTKHLVTCILIESRDKLAAYQVDMLMMYPALFIVWPNISSTAKGKNMLHHL